ncbi:MAG: hypothetical protein EOM14_13190 [Clostridia bacterium]|nr:hypothetical protein [Clostridia bacterium]
MQRAVASGTAGGAGNPGRSLKNERDSDARRGKRNGLSPPFSLTASSGENRSALPRCFHSRHTDPVATLSCHFP